MVSLIQKILTITFLITVNQALSQEIWREDFSEPEKGIWGNGDGSIHSDFSGVATWTLNYENVNLENADDYAKTVSTSGGRFECRDIDGEVIWHSEKIDISDFDEVTVKLTAYETGGNDNSEQKYMKAFYCIDDGDEILFETNGENNGDWGATEVSQSGLNGNTLEIICYMSNHYAGDKVTLDEVTVTAEISLPEIEPNDVVLNEILFNPFPDGNDYVELYNVSAKKISLSSLFLASRDNDGQLVQIYQIANNIQWLEPGSYVALTKDTNSIFPFYSIDCYDCFQQMDNFPSFNNDEDVVVLLNEEMEIIDELHYNEAMHSSFLYDVEGVSLERISVEVATNEPENWVSASTTAGYGTPGYKNSQVEKKDIAQPQVSFEPEAFSPNMDGYNDEYHIHYELNQPGYLANAWIFDAGGRLVMQLANNEILSTNGELIWNGEDETGQQQPLGVYVVAVEIFNEQGNVFRYKDGVVLTDVLD